MSIQAYLDEAKKTQKTLNPMLEKAIQEAQAKLEEAKERAADTRINDMIEAIEQAPLLDEGEAQQVMASLTADMPPGEARSGERIVHRIHVEESNNKFCFADCQTAARAVVMALKGKIPAGLIRWPSWNWFTRALSGTQIERYCYWLAPEQYEQIQQARRQAQEDRAQAEKELAALEQAQESLNNLTFEEVESK